MFGNLPVHEAMKQAVKDSLDSDVFNGYGPAQGTYMRYKNYLSPEHQ